MLPKMSSTIPQQVARKCRPRCIIIDTCTDNSEKSCQPFDGRTIMDIARTVASHVPLSISIYGVEVGHIEQFWIYAGLR